MATQKLSKPEFRQWRESFASLESRFEIVFAKLRSTRTASEARHTPTTPPSVTTPVSPLVSVTTPPTSTPISTPKPTTFSQPTATPEPSLLRATPPAPPLAYASTQNQSSAQNVTTSFQENRAWKIKYYDSEQWLKSYGYSICHQKRILKSASKKCEWRPPWCSVEASPNASRRTEWRPP
ncbi:hypothetical protein HanRHA438_Chr17g0806901 [Helianthus annuus]|nr:hypothetical protein HanRHA438_Chr17g0806901 [Helianthus annuus]